VGCGCELLDAWLEGWGKHAIRPVLGPPVSLKSYLCLHGSFYVTIYAHNRVSVLVTPCSPCCTSSSPPCCLFNPHRPPTDPALMTSFLAAAKGSGAWQARLPPLYIHAASGHPLSLHHSAQQRPHWDPVSPSGSAYSGSGSGYSGSDKGLVVDRCVTWVCGVGVWCGCVVWVCGVGVWCGWVVVHR
jgi:hypothetical protein